MDQRRYPRKQVCLPGSLRGVELFTEGILVDLSRGGCAFRGNGAPQVGDFLEVEIHLSEKEPPVKIEVAAVRWTAGQEFGLEFLLMHAGEGERLRQYSRWVWGGTSPMQFCSKGNEG